MAHICPLKALADSFPGVGWITRVFGFLKPYGNYRVSILVGLPTLFHENCFAHTLELWLAGFYIPKTVCKGF